jgi:hypothetical protein
VWSPEGPPELQDFLRAVEMESGPSYLIDKLLPVDGTVLMSGRAKLAHKTWDAMLMAHALATGVQTALYAPTNPDGVNVLFCELEGPRQFTARRWRSIQASFPAPYKSKIFFAHRYPMILNDVAWQKRLADFVVKERVSLMVIDTLAKSARGDENDSNNIGEVMRAMDYIRSAGMKTTMMFLHHLRKTSGEKSFDSDIDDEIRGSSAIAGHYDVHHALRNPDWNNDILWKTVRDSNGEESVYRMQWDIGTAPLKAELNMTLLARGAPTKELITVCAGKLESGKAYKAPQLLELWELPAALASKVRRELEKGHILEPTQRGWRANT